MSVSEIEKIVCHRCHAVLDLGDNYCRHCGAPTSASIPPPAGPRLGESRLLILIMLFAVLGPLALPMLWRCRCFSRTWKTILTLLVLGATLAVFGLLWYSVQSVFATLTKSMEIRGRF
jgi:hypothetical protein